MTNRSEVNCNGLLYSVLIIGCNRGLGLELARYLLNLKNPPRYLFATCRDFNTSSSLRAYNGFWNKRTKVSVLEMEVTDERQIASTVEFVESKLDGIGLSLLINNAEVHIRKDLEELNSGDMIRAFQTNAIAPLMIAKAFHPCLRSFVLLENSETDKLNLAGIINISSVLGSISLNKMGGMYPYRASKTALNMITKSLSEDMKDQGILTVAIHPGSISVDKPTKLPYNTIVPKIIKFVSSLSMEDTGGFYSCDGVSIQF